MKTIATLVGLLCTVCPAAAQSRLYTNADLTPRPMTLSVRPVTPEELAGLVSRQYRAPLPPGPTVVILPDTPSPRFAPFEPTRPLAEPWSMTTILGHGHHDGGGRFHPTAGPGIHLIYGVR